MVKELQFIDTSALAKRYHAEAGTSWMDELFSRRDARLIISELTLVEIQSVFAIKVRTGSVSIHEYEAVRVLFRSDVTRQRIYVEPLASTDRRRAAHLISKYGMEHSVRTLDALQLAVALRLKSGFGLENFICADRNLASLAGHEGLKTVDPSHEGQSIG